MKHLNKLFNLGLAALSVSPVIASLNTTNVNKTVVLNSSTTDELDESNMRCTIAYVGKKCTKDGLAIIARSNDSTPRASNSYVKRYAHNELANVTIKNEFGFEYTFPSETYSFVSSPDAPKTNPKSERHLWNSMGINEMGVGVTCTLTCSTSEHARSFDPNVDSGIAEEAFNQIIAASADSAKKAMEIAASLVDTYGSEDENILLATDQNETWLMEIYTGHQYCAIKLPDDVMCVAGNEFILDTLDSVGISAANKDNCILSNDLLELPKKNGFAKYDSSRIEDIYHLDLFNTYAEEGTANPDNEGKIKYADSCHMRTWRGYSLFNPTSKEAQLYQDDRKDPAFFKPTDSNGNLRTDMSIYDIMQVYRDEYDELLGQERFKHFDELKAQGKLRAIATESARLVHIITSDPSLPKEIACNALYCPSSANYTPYILLNNGIESVDGQYAYYPERCSYDQQSSSVLFRQMNSIAWPHREKYGYPLQDFWRINEYIYITQMQQVIEDASKLSSISDAKNIITNFNKHQREIYIEMVKNTLEDLIWHDMDQDHRAESKIKEFDPLIDIQQYLTNLGWTDFKQEGNVITFKYGDNTGKLDIGDGYTSEKGKLYINNVEHEINVKYKDNKTYVGLAVLNEAIGDKGSIVKININDYLKKFNHWLWAGPLIGVVALAGIITAFILIRKHKQNNVKRNTKKGSRK